MAKLIGRPMATVGDTTDVHSSAQNIVGTRTMDDAGNEYVYMQGVASCAQGSWVSYDEAYVTTLAVANAQGRVAVAMAAVDAATKYGWFQIYGKVSAKALTGFADNGKVYLTATDGSVDDADVAGDVVIGAIGRSALGTPVSGQSYFELSYPFVMDLAID